MSLFLRHAVAVDLPRLRDLDRRLFPPGIVYDEATFRYYHDHPGAVTLVAEEGEALAGFLIAGAGGDRRLEVVTVDVDPAHRRRGVGRLLLARAHEIARANGLTAARLQVAVDNAGAIAFYETHGYRRTRRIPGYYGGRIDAWEMALTF